MKIIVAALALSLALLSPLVVPAHAQNATPTPGKQKMVPKATMKGVGTQKVIKGTKNAGRETESTIGKDGRKVGKEVSKDTGKVKKSLSKDIRKVEKAVSGQDRKKKSTPPTTPRP